MTPKISYFFIVIQFEEVPLSLNVHVYVTLPLSDSHLSDGSCMEGSDWSVCLNREGFDGKGHVSDCS